MLPRSLLVFAWVLASCSPSIELVVDLKTDLEPGVEFVTVRSELVHLTGDAPDLDSVRLREDDADRTADYLEGRRIAEHADVEAGAYLLDVTLSDARGNVVASREVRITLEASLGFTVVITRDCRGVFCPLPGGAAAQSSCLAGRCVDASCLEGTEEQCPSAECVADTDCIATVPCAEGRCASGVCLFEGRADLCAEGQWCSPESGCMNLPAMMTDTCTPIVEACNGVDDDCDSVADEGFDFDIDVTNCGACGTVCNLSNAMERCNAGSCEIAACNLGFGNCDGEPGTGCETPLDTAIDCGRCGNSCTIANAVEACSAGSCVIGSCDMGFDDCNRDPSDGCEADLASAATCGNCATRCGASAPLCAPGGAGMAGSYSCSTGCPPSTPTICSMSCVDTNTDTRHCGGCGNACTFPHATARCAAGVCGIASCDPGFGDCTMAADDGCEQSLNTLMHCGGCGVPCMLANAASTCATGACRIASCADGWGNCDGIEANGCEQMLMVFYRDMDMDGLGDASMPSAPLCEAPVGYVLNADDCDDTDGMPIAVAPETCDDTDNDCDGAIDEGLYGIAAMTTLTHPELASAETYPPALAFDGGEIGVVWPAVAIDGSDSELFFARVTADLSPSGSPPIRLTDTPDVNTSQNVAIAADGPRWMVAQTQVTGPTPEAMYAFLSAPTYTAPFTSAATSAPMTWLEPGAAGSFYLGHGSTLTFEERMIPISFAGGARSPITLTSTVHGFSGMTYLGGGNIGYALHQGITANLLLTYHQKAEATGASLASVTNLTPPMSTSSGRVRVFRAGGKIAIVTSTSWAGAEQRAVLVLVNPDATGEMVMSMAGREVAGLGFSGSNASIGMVVDGNLHMRTETGAALGTPIPLPASGPTSGIAGPVGSFAFVVGVADRGRGVQLYGIACMP